MKKILDYDRFNLLPKNKSNYENKNMSLDLILSNKFHLNEYLRSLFKIVICIKYLIQLNMINLIITHHM